MSAHPNQHHSSFKQEGFLFKTVSHLLAWFLGVMFFLAFPALAQPAKGVAYKEFLPMGSGASVPLPEGAWQLTHSGLFRGVKEYEIYTLRNQQVDAKVPFLVVSQSTTVSGWPNTNCASDNSQSFMVNEHGTLSNQLLNKCSRVKAISNFDTWKGMSGFSANNKKWWSESVPGLIDPEGPPRRNIFQVEFTVQQHNGKRLSLHAFVVPPKALDDGLTDFKIKEGFMAASMKTEYDILSAWKSLYIDSIHQGYFNKKPQPIMALAYSVKSRGQTQFSSTDSSLPIADRAVPNPDVQADQKAHDQRTEEILRELAANQSVSNPAPVVVAAPPVKPATAPPVKPTGAPVAMNSPDKSARERLDQERRAMDEEKRTMAQQLAVMTEMLVKLQQESAAAALAAAKAKEQQASKPEPAAQTSRPVTFASRKALVIGNDLYSQVSKLTNAGADADAMARSLELVGYKVYKHLNLSEKRFKQAVREFKQQLNAGDEVLFFYAGHGVQLGNANYLLPIDVQGEHEDQVKDDAILLQKVLDDLDEKKTKFALAVIDACRDNPFKGKGRAIGGRGLAPTTAATGQMIMFSAGSGQQALDRLGESDKEKNGLFTRVFVKEMVKPGLSVDRVLRNVRTEVVRLARSVGHEQTPALYDQAIGEFYFKQ
jgi:hypothetical protein